MCRIKLRFRFVLSGLLEFIAWFGHGGGGNIMCQFLGKFDSLRILNDETREPRPALTSMRAECKTLFGWEPRWWWSRASIEY